MHQTFKSPEKFLVFSHYRVFKSQAVIKGYNATMDSWTVCIHCYIKCSTWLVMFNESVLQQRNKNLCAE